MPRRLKRLIGGVHRRSLWQVLGIYLVASWAVLQVVDTLGGALNLPDWFPSFALALLLVGLPIVMATAFVQSPGLDGDDVDGFVSGVADPPVAAFRLLTWRNAIAGGVLAFALWGVIAAGWVLLGSRGGIDPTGRGGASIAVLPFDNLSADPDDRYIADGVHDEIIAQLSRIGSLQVISRTSVLEYRDTPKNSRTIATELGVDALLGGSVRRVGEQVRIIAELVDAETEVNIWVETYARELTPANLFDVQEGVARRVAQSLAANLSAEEADRLALRPTDNLEAYNLYLQGNDYLTRSDSEEALRIAERMYESAVEIDPGFALAFAKLSRVHSSMFWYYFDRSAERATRAREAAERALNLGPDLPEAHGALGTYYYWVRLDYERALAELATASRQRPNDGALLQTLGFIQRRQGRWDEAAEHIARAARLNPRSSPDALQAGITHLYTGEYDKGLEYFERAGSLAPDLIRPFVWQARVHLSATGDTARVRELLAEAERANPTELDNQAWWHWALYRVLDGPSPHTLERLENLRVPPEFYHAAKAELLGRRGQPELMRAHYDSARAALERSVRELPDEARFHSELGIALAGLGRAEEAVREGRRAVELVPISREAVFGQDWLANLARIYVMIGEFDEAVDVLETMREEASPISGHWLRLDPVYAPMAGYPAFEALKRRASD
jgi:TolB-like protein/Flp pilus assembly protein TadD